MPNFDVTSALHAGKNNVSVQVIRWTDGSYLEGQDVFHMSGIHRDVYLVATPRTFVRDHYITADLNATKRYKSGSLNVQLELDNRDKTAANKRVEVTLLDPDGQQVAQSEKTVAFAAGETSKKVDIVFENLNDLRLWTAETPRTLLRDRRAKRRKRRRRNGVQHAIWFPQHRDSQRTSPHQRHTRLL